MARSTEDATDFADIDNSVDEMPKIRGNYTVTEPVKQLMDAIQDHEVHRITNVGDKKNRDRWGRKLRYAANKLEKEVSIVYVPETEDKPGIYFRGYEKGEAPSRGRRTQVSSTASEKDEDFGSD